MPSKSQNATGRPMKRIKYLLIAALALVSCNRMTDEEAFSETLRQIVENGNWLIGENEETIKNILALVEGNPESLDYELEEWELEGEYPVSIITSEDGAVRVYNLNTIVPDGNRNFGPDGMWLIQYRAGDVVKTVMWKDKSSLLTEICPVYARNNTYYLFREYACYCRQGEFFNEAVTAYSISANTSTLQEIKLFYTGKEHLSRIELDWVDYDIVDDRLLYSECNNIVCDDCELRIPLVNEAIMTEGYLLYLWDGNFFSYAGIEPIAEFTAGNFTVKIEILPDGRYKYYSWGKGKSMNDVPDMILYDGKMECWDETGWCECNSVYDNGVSTILGRVYTFENKGYTYCFETGWREGTYADEFRVSKGEEIILSKEVKYI